MIIYGVLFAIIPIAIIAAIFIPTFNSLSNPEERETINRKLEMCEESNSGDTVVIDGKEYEC